MTLRVRTSGAAAPLVIETVAGEQLSRAIWLFGGIAPQLLCAGMGRCGRCRTRFVKDAPPPLPAEEAILPREDLALGWRLACRRQTPDGSSPLDLELPGADADARAEAKIYVNTAEELVLAVDLGTTSVCWQALVAKGKERGLTAAEGRFLNPQAGAGADVMSRLAMAADPRGRRLLSDLVRKALQGVLAALPGRVSRLCLAGNTAMTDIFLDRDVAGLCAAPYRTSHSGHETVRLPGLPPIYIPPLPAPFVGGDISAGLALLAVDAQRPFILADMGTNGEFALVGREEVFLASVPLGPALEGIGLECGQLAGPETITEFFLTPSGLAARAPGGEITGQARGISATGYLSLLAALLGLKLLDNSGHFTDAAPATPLARKVAAGMTRQSRKTRLNLPCSLWLSAPDVEELLKVKASFALALDKLSAAAAVPWRDMTLYLAGALGEHVDPGWLETTGFAPGGLRVRNAGNTALKGAALLALQPEAGEAAAQLCARARVLSLAEDPDFQRDYCKQMRFGV